MEIQSVDQEFRQFLAGEVRRQTMAAEETAAHAKRLAQNVSTILTLLVIFAVLTLLGVVMAVVSRV